MAVTASFANDLLTIIADALDNNVEASRNAAGQILVNGGAGNVVGGTPTLGNTRLIPAFGQGRGASARGPARRQATAALPRPGGRGGDERAARRGASGPPPPANLFGGAGN